MTKALLADYSTMGSKGSDATEQLSTHKQHSRRSTGSLQRGANRSQTQAGSTKHLFLIRKSSVTAFPLWSYFLK